MRMLTLLVTATLLATPAYAQKATTATESPSVALPPELDRVLRDYEQNWTEKNPPGLAELFAEDGFALMSGTTGARGRPAIAKIYAGAGGELKLRALAYATEGNTGYIIGAYGYGAGSQDTGKFVLALQRVGGKWLIAADIDNGNRR
jgi:hypothetical protein